MEYGKPILVICQKSKVQDWVNHFNSVHDVPIVYDLTKKNAIISLLSDGHRYQWVGVINYQLAWRRKELSNIADYTLILDESSLIQNSKAKQTKFILKLHPSNVILCSGTPVSGKYQNMWTQLKLLGYPQSESTFLKRYVNFVELDLGYGYPVKIVNKYNPYRMWMN